MNIQNEITNYIASQPEAKRTDMLVIHELVQQISPGCRLWFLDGKDASGKVVSNPNIGYGTRKHKFADGTIDDFYGIGLSANKTGISVYILGIEDKNYLRDHFADAIGKADVTGYCIRFRKLADVDVNVLESAIRFGFDNTDH